MLRAMFYDDDDDDDEDDDGDDDDHNYHDDDNLNFMEVALGHLLRTMFYQILCGI